MSLLPDMLGLGCGAILWLTAMAQLGRDQSDLHNRQSWGFTILGMLLGGWLTTINLWAGLLTIWVSLLTQVMLPVSVVWQQTALKSLVLVAGYGVAVNGFQLPWVPWLFGGMVVIGTLTTIWALLMLATKPYPSRDFHLVIPGTPFWIYDNDKTPQLRGGQGNPNHYDALVGLSVAAGAGLLHLGYGWPLPCLVLMVTASLLHHEVTQGHVYFGATALGLGLLAHPDWPVVVIFSGIGVAGLLWWRPWRLRGPHTIASGRIDCWLMMLKIWWRGGWKIRVCGYGTGSWLHRSIQHRTASHQADKMAIWTVAHNEFVQQLFEYGLLGMLLLMGLVGSLLWAAWQAGPLGEAVWLVGLVACAIASLNFPWTWFQTLPDTGRQRTFVVPKEKLRPGMPLTRESTGLPLDPQIPLRYQMHPQTGDLIIEEVPNVPPLFVGSPALLWWNWLVAVMVTKAGLPA